MLINEFIESVPMANLGITSASFRIETALSNSNREVSKNIERLATGDANANAGDRSSYVAMSDTFQLDMAATSSAIRSAAVAMGYLETTTEVLNSASTLLARLQELAVLSLNDTNTTSDNDAINSELQALGNEFNRLMTSAQYKEKDLFVTTAHSELLALGGRSQERSFGVEAVDYADLLSAINAETQYLGTQANPLVSGTTYEIVDKSRLTTWINNWSPRTTLPSVDAYLAGRSDLSSADDVIEGAKFTPNRNLVALTDALGVKEVRGSLTELIEKTQQNVNDARVMASAQYAAIENAISFATDLRVQYQLGNDTVSEVNFSSETAYLAKNQILQQAATAMLIQANQGQRGLLQLISS
jgi:flagellin